MDGTQSMKDSRWTPRRLLGRTATSVSSACSFRFAPPEIIRPVSTRLIPNPLQPLDNAPNLWYYYDCFQAAELEPSSRVYRAVDVVDTSIAMKSLR